MRGLFFNFFYVLSLFSYFGLHWFIHHAQEKEFFPARSENDWVIIVEWILEKYSMESYVYCVLNDDLAKCTMYWSSRIVL